MTNDEFLAQADRTIWRLEARRQYNPRTDEAFQAWRRTGRLLPERPAKWAWMAAVRRAVASGRQVGRVRVRWSADDQHPYARYELAVYPENQAAGEDVRIADLTAHPEAHELADARDFWLFDEHLALLMDYDTDGQFLSMTRTTDPAAVASCLAWRDLDMACSVPLDDYLADLRGVRAG